MSFLLGLTGSIGMGKSTAAMMFQDLGLPIWDADSTVHALYGPSGEGAKQISLLVPRAVTAVGVDRKILKVEMAKDQTLLKRIEGVIHPLVTANRAAFIAGQTADILVFDIPLLFETNAQDQFGAVAVVSTDAVTQRGRVLARGGMDLGTFEMVLEKQLPDAEKRERADFIIDSSTLEAARADVADIVATIRERVTHA